MTNVLAIQNTRNEGSGLLGRLLESDGFDTKYVNAKHESIPKDDFSFLLVLGAPESANDELPYLREEEKLIQKFVKDEKPVLGICLGSQLIAKAFGASVYAGPKKEIGFYHDLYVDDNTNFFSGIENPFTVFHWHGDTFDLPKGATRLAHSKDYQNQAFQFQSAVGLQFHLEVDETMVKMWLDNTREELDQIPYIDSDKIRQDIEQNMSTVNGNLKKFYKNFKSTFQL